MLHRNWLRAALTALAFATQLHADIEISEFLAANSKGLIDAYGDYSDWIEIQNTGAEVVNLKGWSLTDDPTQTDKWIFPEQQLAPGAQLVVFATGRPPTNTVAELHANFSLNSAGGYLGLFRPEATRAESEFAPQYPAQRPDISFGRRDGKWLFFATPTPRNPNTGGFADFVADTKFSVDRGFFTNQFTVTITCETPGVTIRYTTNGTPPLANSGFIYSEPIAILGTRVIRAAAFKEGFQPSNVDTHSYLFPSDIILQAANGNAPAGWPASWGSNVRDYGMDPDIVNDPRYRKTIQNDLQTLPSFCVNIDLNHLFNTQSGIYANPGQDGRDWERPCSLELVYPNGTKGFQINAGIRIRGGFSRSTGNPKHAFRFFFREQYGDSKLRFPLFGDRGTEVFDAIDLRTFQNYSWSFQGDSRGVFIRDQFSRDTQLDMGQPAERGDYYHLYINGMYWGLYNTCERPEASYAATYFGGNKEDYDVIKVEAGPYTINATDGTLAAWQRLYNAGRVGFTNNAAYFKVQGLNPDQSPNSAYENLIDLDNLIDYMLIIFYGGNLDAPISNFLGNSSPNNWYGVRDRTGAHGGFRFFSHDAEHTLLNVNEDRVGPFSSGDSGVSKSNPQWIFQKLWDNAEFRLRVADRIQKHMFNGGALTVASARARFLKRKNEIDRAVVAESARWGDSKSGSPLNRDDHWVPAVNDVLDNFINDRNPILLEQLRSRDLFPSVAAATFSQHGGFVNLGSSISITAPAGTIYWTSTGADPRLVGGAINPAAKRYTAAIPINAGVTLKARVKNGNDWSPVIAADFAPRQTFTDVTINEFMYHPKAGGGRDKDDYEFIEFKNTGAVSRDLSGMQLTNGVLFTFPPESRIGPGEFLVVVANAQAFTNRYPKIPVAGVYGGRLANDTDRITWLHADGTVVLDFTYQDNLPWPSAADGGGFSLVAVDPAGPEDRNLPSSWRASSAIHGNPGAADSVIFVSPVVVNEVLTRPTFPFVDSVELYNPGTNEVDIGGWYLSDDRRSPKKYQFPPNTKIDSRAYHVVTANEFGALSQGTNAFGLDAQSDELYLFAANGNGELLGFDDGFQFGGTPTGVSLGRWTNSVGRLQFPTQQETTLGKVNSGPAIPTVIFNEILFAPSPGDLEFVEIKNLGSQSLALFAPGQPTNTWIIRGTGFQFPPNVTIPPGGIALVVDGDPILFRASQGLPDAVLVFGPLGNSLQDRGEKLELQRPDLPYLETNGVLVRVVQPYITIDAVEYSDQPPWPLAATARGNGSSLERKSPIGYGDDPMAWKASSQIPSPGTENTSNRPPIASAGDDQSFESSSYPVHATLIATARDDGLPRGTLGYRWTQTGGPGVAVIESPESASTPIQIPGTGIFTFKVAVSDTDRTVTDEIVVNTTRAAQTTTLLPAGSAWKYLDDGSDQGTLWQQLNFDDSLWKTGPAQLGYSTSNPPENDEKTVIGFGLSAGNKFLTYYFRMKFPVADARQILSINSQLLRDDGAVIYLNGEEVRRDNLPEDFEIKFDTRASSVVGGGDESTFFEKEIDVSALRNGLNTLAVEVHQSGPDSSDLSFDLALVARISGDNLAPTVNAGADQSIKLPLTASLRASYSDDGLPVNPGTLKFLWSKVSGPGSVSFGDSGNPWTTASFSQAGDYVVRFEADEGSGPAGKVRDDLKISVTGTTLASPLLRISHSQPAKLEWNGIAGVTYEIQRRNSLETGSWLTIQTVAGLDGMLTFELTEQSLLQFFRVLVR